MPTRMSAKRMTAALAWTLPTGGDSMSSRAVRSILFGALTGLAFALASGPPAFADAIVRAGPHAPPSAGDAPGSAPVDVTIKESTAERRVVAIEWNPVALFINRLSANVEIVPADHHALVLNPFYFDSHTAAFGNASGSPAPSQRFEGFGGEIGYRYYAGHDGPRGFFAGPSLIAASVQATPSKGPQTSLIDYGVALDVGWQALVESRWVVSLGAGGEYMFTSLNIPDQQAPASYYVGGGLHPRILAAVGCAF